MPTAVIQTLGCRLNQADTALMAEQLRLRGFRILPRGASADLIVINSCTVTGEAARKTRQALRAARRRAPEAFIVLAGCDADVHPDAWGPDSGADLVIPNALKIELARLLPHPLVRPSAPSTAAPISEGGSGGADGFRIPGTGAYPHRTRANLKVQEGCDFFCSFCVVPAARGRPRSRDWDDVLREARELLERGHHELVVTGVNLLLYRDAERERGLAELVEALCRLDGDYRIRLSSVEPGPGLERVIDVMARTPRVCPSLHLPLQYGEDRILRAMNRRYAVAEFAGLVRRAVSRIPELCLGTDVIVGFPGEDDEAFEACRRVLVELPFAYFHVFSYSPRGGTPAAARPGRPDPRLTAERAAVLRELSKAKGRAFAGAFRGRDLVVLPETRTAGGGVTGWSGNYLRVEIPAPDAPLNTLIPCRVTRVLGPRKVAAELCDRRRGSGQ
ncbi:MAG: tRNA (N(6)-L-threonylcarbamoyladenosine(37)-C(2))-methylthiotransferase MtaB [Kiritimatiellaeota bacterium]|nr:tRNA (N(6)-L-threonylcarbamoyladenosine(37)-C(2))-methylthiotransferase MtaB [Kiritimatiellota bacterium]